MNLQDLMRGTDLQIARGHYRDARLFDARAHNIGQRFGLTGVEAAVLGFLEERCTCLMPEMAADLFGAASAGDRTLANRLGELARRLERQGYITMNRDANDRVTRVTRTDKPLVPQLRGAGSSSSP